MGRGGLGFWYYTVVNLLEVLFHLVWPREFFLTNRTGENLSLCALMIKKGVSLETVFVLEALDNLDLFTLNAPVGAIARYVGVFEQV